MLRMFAIPLATASLLACASSGPAPGGRIGELEEDPSAATPAGDPAAVPPEDSASAALAPAAGVASVRDIEWLAPQVQAHAALIDDAARRHGVDARLVGIVIWVESRGRVDAESPAGARGLMQIMPATAAAIASDHGLAEPTLQTLMEPKTNIDLGVRHLADLIADVGDAAMDDASVHRVATAYNGGINVVLQERTPSDETQRYAETVEALWRARDSATKP